MGDTNSVQFNRYGFQWPNINFGQKRKVAEGGEGQQTPVNKDDKNTLYMLQFGVKTPEGFKGPEATSGVKGVESPWQAGSVSTGYDPFLAISNIDREKRPNYEDPAFTPTTHTHGLGPSNFTLNLIA